MKLAFSTLGCPGWPWEDIYAVAKDMGFDGIEIRGIANEMYAPNIKIFSEAELENTRKLLADSNLQIPLLSSAACVGLDSDQSLKEAKAYIDLAQRLGTPSVRVFITSNPRPTEEENVFRAQKNFSQLCAYAAPKGITVLIETSGKLADSKEMAEFMTAVDCKNAGVLWDIHHPYRFYGETPEYTYSNLKDWIRYIHIKDSVMQNGEVQYRMLGYGDVPVFDTLKILSQNRFDGFISLEWVKRWCPDLQEPGIVFHHFITYMEFMIHQL